MPIVITSDTCDGQPRIDGHRISVSNILRALVSGFTIREICNDWNLSEAEVSEAILWAVDYIEERF